MGTIIIIVLIFVILDRALHYFDGGEDEPGKFKQPSTGCLLVIIIGICFLFWAGSK